MDKEETKFDSAYYKGKMDEIKLDSAYSKYHKRSSALSQMNRDHRKELQVVAQQYSGVSLQRKEEEIDQKYSETEKKINDYYSLMDQYKEALIAEKQQEKTIEKMHEEEKAELQKRKPTPLKEYSLSLGGGDWCVKVKLKSIDWKGMVGFPSFCPSIGEVETPKEALSKATEKMEGMIHPAGGTALTIAKADLLGYRMDEAKLTVIVESISVPILGEIYANGEGFKGLGGKLFAALLQGNSPFVVKMTDMLDQYGSLGDFLSNPSLDIDGLTGAIKSVGDGINLGQISGILDSIGAFDNPLTNIDFNTGALTQNLQEIINGIPTTVTHQVGHLDVVTQGVTSKSDVLSGISSGSMNLDKTTGIVTDMAGEEIARIAEYANGVENIPGVQELLQSGSSHMLNMSTGASENFRTMSTVEEIERASGAKIGVEQSLIDALNDEYTGYAGAKGFEFPKVIISGMDKINNVILKHNEAQDEAECNAGKVGDASRNIIKRAEGGYQSVMSRWGIVND